MVAGRADHPQHHAVVGGHLAVEQGHLLQLSAGELTQAACIALGQQAAENSFGQEFLCFERARL
jgi:hypothetical protein